MAHECSSWSLRRQDNHQRVKNVWNINKLFFSTMTLLASTLRAEQDKTYHIFIFCICDVKKSHQILFILACEWLSCSQSCWEAINNELFADYPLKDLNEGAKTKLPSFKQADRCIKPVCSCSIFLWVAEQKERGTYINHRHETLLF